MTGEMPSFVQLQKKANAKTISDNGLYKLAVLGDCATQHLSKAILGYSIYTDNEINVFDTDYNQITANLFDKKSEVYTYRPDFTLLFMSSEKLFEKWCNTPDERRSSFAEDNFTIISQYWKQINDMHSKCLQFLFIEDDNRIFGNYGLKVDISFYYQLKKLNWLLMERQGANVYLLDINTIRSRLGTSKFSDKKMYYMAKMAISIDALPFVAKMVIDTINAIKGKVKKCIILDLDNTLWGGVIGDDGLEGIQIGELGSGHAFSDFQLWLKELSKRGILLAICSKNNEDIAKSAFIEHPEMILRLDDIAIFMANWNDKAANIRYIQQRLNIGMDSIVFLDDNEFERNLVKELIPEITVPDLPEEPEYYVDYLKSLNLFETASYSVEDKNRTQQYQAEENRHSLEIQSDNYDDYLISLNMIAYAAPFDKFHFSRIAQLTQRSNQFNLRTVRYTEDQISNLAADASHLTLYFTLKDKFGDHGLISVVILDKLDDETLFISEWLMSCRVLKRGMEEFIINTIIENARDNGFRRVVGEYIPTKKNKMVADIYSREGFVETEPNRFRADVDGFEYRQTYIKREKEYE